MADKIVAPGEQIKPQIDLDGAVALAERIYGIKVDSAKELNGYDDKNYHLKVSQPPNNKYMTTLWEHGYVLKIMNSSDSKKLNFVDAQGELMLFLVRIFESGIGFINTPQPQKNLDGKHFSLETIQSDEDGAENTGSEHVVRLLSYQEGTLLKDIPWSFALHYEVGRCAANLDLTLQNFSHPGLKTYSSLWMLKNLPNIKKYLYVVKDKDDVSLVEKVIKEFEEKVLSNFDSLTQGIIHGDIHDQNLVCQQTNGDKWELSAVLDFGDIHYSAYVIELAQTMTYMMMQSESVESGHYVIDGYCSLLLLSPQEITLLKVCVCARLCQSLVLGLYTFSQSPENTYVLSTQGPGWKLLHTLWDMDKSQLDDLWFMIPELESN